MKILITGSNNYIANDIIELFSKDNKNEIIATYNKKKPRLKKKNIKLIKPLRNFISILYISLKA